MRVNRIPRAVMRGRTGFPSPESRVRGCIFAAVAGDALGAPVEGMSAAAIKEKFGSVENYISNPAKPKMIPGQWTDDSALLLATLSSLVEKRQVDLEDISFRMKMAYTLERFRGYGLTTRRALEGNRRKEKNAGNGAASRVAATALFTCLNLEEMRQVVTETSQITHLHPEAINGALAMAFAIASAVKGEIRPHTLIQKTVAFIGATSEVSHKLFEIHELLQHPEITVEEGLEYIGTRGYVFESVGSAFYAFLKTPRDLARSVINVVNAGGDTDTIGAMTGALSGAYNGYEAIPRKWISGLEATSEIRSLVESFNCLLFELSRLPA